jgi:hypothetical protein
VGASVAIGPAVSDPVNAEKSEKSNRYLGSLFSTETVAVEREIRLASCLKLDFVNHTGLNALYELPGA